MLTMKMFKIQPKMPKNLLKCVFITACVFITHAVYAQHNPVLSNFNGGGQNLNNAVRSNFNEASNSFNVRRSFGSSSRRGFGFVGSGSIGTTHTNPHSASVNKLRQQLREEKRLRQIRTANPPCGVYGRVPARCRTGKLNVAVRP